MVSTRGAITTNTAMVECASAQVGYRRDVFLLTELEKAWAALSVLMRRKIIDGFNVNIPHLGVLWTKETVVAEDIYQNQYCTRQLCFGINNNFALRYRVNTVTVPLAQPNADYRTITVADIVSVCKVPARTVSMALKEFALYLGEGLFRGRVFQLSMPGLATLLIKKEKCMLTTEWELQRELFDIDSRKWPAEMRTLGLETLEKSVGLSSLTDSDSPRPTSALSRDSWRQGKQLEARPVFVPAAPTGRLFSDIAKDRERRLTMEQARQSTCSAGSLHSGHHSVNVTECGSDAFITSRGPQNSEGRSNAPSGCYNPACVPPPAGCSMHAYRPPTASAESIYEILPDSQHESMRGGAEIEAVEVIQPAPMLLKRECLSSNERSEGSMEPNRPQKGKNADLEKVLSQEECFSRPLSRRPYHEPCSMRELLYFQPDTERFNREPHRQQGSRGSHSVPATPAGSSNDQAAGAVETPTMRYGRKRFFGVTNERDSVADLLKGPL